MPAKLLAHLHPIPRVTHAADSPRSSTHNRDRPACDETTMSVPTIGSRVVSHLGYRIHVGGMALLEIDGPARTNDLAPELILHAIRSRDEDSRRFSRSACRPAISGRPLALASRLAFGR